MRLAPFVFAAFFFAACGGAPPAETPADIAAEPSPLVAPAETPAADADETARDTSDATPSADEKGTFVIKDAGGSAKAAHGVTPSKLAATKTEALIKFVVVDKEKQVPIPGIVISLTAPDGAKYHTAETDAEGYSEVLVPIGQKYDLVYLSLGRQDVTANVAVPDEPRKTIKLTLRYKRFEQESEPRFVLDGVQFDTGKATLRPESFPRLDGIAEYLKHKPSSRIQISGHTDDVGNPKTNKLLSEQRARACRDYLISQGIDGSRIEAVGYGSERPIATNTTPEGRQANRRIEATER